MCVCVWFIIIAFVFRLQLVFLCFSNTYSIGMQHRLFLQNWECAAISAWSALYKKFKWFHFYLFGKSIIQWYFFKFRFFCFDEKLLQCRITKSVCIFYCFSTKNKENLKKETHFRFLWRSPNTLLLSFQL